MTGNIQGYSALAGAYGKGGKLEYRTTPIVDTVMDAVTAAITPKRTLATVAAKMAAKRQLVAASSGSGGPGRQALFAPGSDAAIAADHAAAGSFSLAPPARSPFALLLPVGLAVAVLGVAAWFMFRKGK